MTVTTTVKDGRAGHDLVWVSIGQNMQQGVYAFISLHFQLAVLGNILGESYLSMLASDTGIHGFVFSSKFSIHLQSIAIFDSHTLFWHPHCTDVYLGPIYLLYLAPAQTQKATGRPRSWMPQYQRPPITGPDKSFCHPRTAILYTAGKLNDADARRHIPVPRPTYSPASATALSRTTVLYTASHGNMDPMGQSRPAPRTPHLFQWPRSRPCLRP
ncbi:uncharacterized protein CC84DRAFT_430384 [Paraphaeosphaeria sporulosa]|uniref:Uncharacterized protein n=1 Tax=Paraphaeosphaeria sporulosa TaxID=1460663 RepID=A0A177CQG2_9PLEO|nr:uncharacterized protein CC84DRAFT_430384 [Paraphaeosphaeria sporulosa]OAG09182.1 hypothetical protein CC84DRAFT_430384 [Paraphaeosphaeria sporulosa]